MNWNGTKLRLNGLLLASLAGYAFASSAHAEPNFSGKTIRFAIASTPGGPTDLMGRTFAPFIARHLPGKPEIVIENRPGAVGVIAANYIYNIAKPDGLTVGVLLGMVTSGLMRDSGVQYDPAKFEMIGAISATQVLLVRKDLGLKVAADLLKPAKPLVLASLGAGSTTDAANRLFLDMIGAKFRYVTGYPGQAETILAIERDEASLANASHNIYLSQRESIANGGVYDAFLQRGELTASGKFTRNTQLPEFPTMVEAIESIKPEALNSADFAAYKSLVGSMAVHYSFVLPPKTPTDIVDAFRKAFEETMKDPETRAAVQKMIKSDYEYVKGADGKKIIEELAHAYNADPRIDARLHEIMTAK